MAKKALKEEYFLWLCDIVGTRDDYTYYTCLLELLHNREFVWSIPLDANRAKDGQALRRRFADESGHTQRNVETILDSPCSVLEMLIALADRCETHIMSDDDIGDRTEEWFWTMIENLQLTSMENGYFDEEYSNHRIDILLDRTYEKNGSGGLFIINEKNVDMRKLEIWYQMQHYLNEKFNN